MEEKKSEAAVVATKPDDPIFMELVRHSESVRTQLTHRGLVSLMHLLGADTAQMSLHDDGGLHIIIDACDRHYIVWHYPDEHFTVEGYVDTLVADGEKNWTEVNKYDSRHGMQMANGRRRGGGVMAAFNPCLPVLVVGGSGSGKTYSIKGFAGCPSAVGVLSVEKGRLPFRSGIKTVKVPEAFQGVTTAAALHKAKYGWVEHVITASRPGMSLVVDDSQYLLANELFDRAQERGYDKFLDMASNFRHLVHYINTLDGGKIVYFLHHEETDADGRAKAKTIGRMLDEKLVLEGCFDVVLYCRDHKFFTQGNGVSTAKSPEGMFDEIEVENNLKIVDDAIRAYYGMPSIRTEEHN